MWNRFDKSIISEILTEDLRFRGSLGQSKNGYSEFGEYVDFVQRAFPDFSNEIEEIISEGDKAFAKLLYRGIIGARSSVSPDQETRPICGRGCLQIQR
jgi:predicted ester cyclase